MNEVVQVLQKESPGPWDMASYMEKALYDKTVGYYQEERVKLGKAGDFYTNNHVHPVFGRVFARFFVDVIKKEALPPMVMELGAGEGRFTSAVLTYVADHHPSIYQDMSYIVIEQSRYHRDQLWEQLADHKEKLQVFSDFSGIEQSVQDFEGIVFSNEFYDALPVHQVEYHSGQWYEILVQEENGEMKETVVLCNNTEILTWLSQYGPDLPDGYRTEVNLSMKEWIYALSRWMKRGLMTAVDYGYRNDELLRPERKAGSLRGYKDHKLIDDPLKYPGEMDLTHHVQWDAYDSIAGNEGFKTIIHARQDQFLLKAGLFSFLETPNHIDPFSDVFKLNRAIQNFVQPGGISFAFQVDVKGKGICKEKEYKLFNEDPYRLKNRE